MAQRTKLGVDGTPRPFVGSFTGKGKQGGPFTRLGLYGGPRPRYVSFEGREGKTGLFTRLGLYGGPRPRYGDFSLRITPPPTEPGFAGAEFDFRPGRGGACIARRGASMGAGGSRIVTMKRDR